MLSINNADPVNTFFTVLGFLIIIGLAVSIHEASHAYVANRLGDPTARLMGRMTLSPFAHIDPIGTVVIPFILLILSQGRLTFGWAKPTPINPLNFRHPRRDSAIVALAGPVSNFLLAVIFAFLFRIFHHNPLVNILLLYVVQLNLMLGLFNLIPFPPLDGSKVVMGVLPREAAASFATLEVQRPAFLMISILLFIFFFWGPLIAAVNFLTSLLVGA